MSNETMITVIGNLVDDPELRFTPAGAAVAKFRVASVPRTFNKQTSEWEDAKDGLFLTCAVWRQAAENCAESLRKGMRVIVQGRLKQRSYEDREGVKRTVYEVDVEEVGVSLKNATAKVSKSGGSGNGRSEFQQARQQRDGRQGDDPWADSAPAAAGGWGGGVDSAEPPF